LFKIDGAAAVVNRQQIIVDTLFPMARVPSEGLTVKHIHTGTWRLAAIDGTQSPSVPVDRG
jgi:hypothetical protein